MELKVKGLDELRELMGGELEEKLLQVLYDNLEVTANEILNQAKLNAPVDMGLLRAGMEVEPSKTKTTVLFVIQAVADYAGYIEFGTKTRVDVPPEMAEIARDIMNNPATDQRSYEDFVVSIMEWATRKGIPRELQGAIIASIYSHGNQPHPFLFPAYEQFTVDLVPKLSKALDDYVNRMI